MDGIVAAGNQQGGKKEECNIQPHNSEFDDAIQVQVIVPKSVFERHGVEITPVFLRKLASEVLLKMLRFYDFRLGSQYLLTPTGDARILLERQSWSINKNYSVRIFVLPEQFTLPPQLLKLNPDGRAPNP